jgi:signal transduction histidine kinase/Tfp pilus assembly protein PilF
LDIIYKILIIFNFLLFSLLSYAIPDSLKQAYLNENDVKNRQILIEKILESIHTNKLDSAIFESKKVYELAKLKTDYLGMADAANYISDFYQKTSLFKEALSWSHTALKYAKKTQDPDKLLDSYLSITSNHQSLFNEDSMMYYAAITKEKAIEQNNNFILGSLYVYLANYFVDKYVNDSAMFYYTKALHIFREEDNLSAMGVTLGNIGILYMNDNEYEKAKKQYLSALKINTGINQTREIANNHNNLGILYKELNQLDSAKYHYEKAIVFNRENGDYGSIAISYHNLGNLSLKTNDYNQAESYYFKSLHICDSIDLEIGLAYNYSGLAELYSLTNNHKKALDYLLQADVISKKYQLNEIVLKNTKYIADTYKILGNVEMAFQYLENYIQLKDSIDNLNIKESIEKYKILFETEQKENTILEQQAENENKSRQLELNRIKQERLIIITFLISLIFIGVIIFYIRLRFNHKKIIKQSETIQRYNNQLQKSTVEINEQSKQLKSQNDKLEELTKFRDNIINTMVHDLKTPLNTIIGMSRMSPNIKHNEYIHYAGLNMLNLVSNILDVQKQQDNKLNVAPEILNIEEIIEQAKNEVYIDLNAKQQEIITDLHPKTVFADKTMLRRILVNLISNASKYSKDKSKILIRTEIIDENTTKIQVQDYGMGIDSNIIDKLFQPFYSFNPKDFGLSYSSGIGLSFCKIAVNAMGGDIEIQSQKHEGTTVSFTLPNQNA